MTQTTFKTCFLSCKFYTWELLTTFVRISTLYTLENFPQTCKKKVKNKKLRTGQCLQM